MGEIADYMGEQMMDEDFNEMYQAYDKTIDLLESKPKNILWTTKDGTQLKLCEMTNNHLQNCINLVKRKPDFDGKDTIIYYLQKELNRRK